MVGRSVELPGELRERGGCRAVGDEWCTFLVDTDAGGRGGRGSDPIPPAELFL